MYLIAGLKVADLSKFQEETTFQTSLFFHIETSQMICSEKQMIGLYMKCSIWADAT